MAQTYYLVVYLASATDPADDATGHGQIKDGKDGDGATAAFAGSTTWAGSPGQIDITGLSAGTLYGWAAVVYDDVALTYSNRVLGTETYTAVDITGTVALSGTVTPTGDLEIGTNPDLAASALSLTGTLTPTGDLEIGTSFDLAASTLSLSGTLTPTGDIQSSVDPVLDVEASALAVTGTLTPTGDFQIGTSFDLAASGALTLSGSLTPTGDISIGVGFDLAASALSLSGTLTPTGDFASSTETVAPPAQGSLSFFWPTRKEKKKKKKPEPAPEPTIKEQIRAELETQFREAEAPPTVPAVPEDPEESQEEDQAELELGEEPEEAFDEPADAEETVEAISPEQESQGEPEARLAAQLATLDALISRLEAHEQSLIRSRRRAAQQRLLLM